MKHLSFWNLVLTESHNLASRQGLVGSLTGAVPTKRVTVGLKGWLSPDGNRAGRVRA